MRTMILACVLASYAGAVSAQPAALTAPDPQGLLVIVVRHAEKAQDDPRDPTLSERGLERAQTLASRLQGLEIDAAYATPFKRTQLTARAVAQAHGLDVQVREFVSANPDEDAQALREMLLHQHRGEAVLVVGHSNTVPAIVEALSGVEAEPMPETEYDRLSVVRIDADGQAELSLQRY